MVRDTRPSVSLSSLGAKPAMVGMLHRLGASGLQEEGTGHADVQSASHCVSGGATDMQTRDPDIQPEELVKA